MSLPVVPRYPEEFDGNDNLYEVHDAVRFRLTKDYNPGDTSIQVEGNLFSISNMPSNGQITITEQCSELENRAISFYYTDFDSDAMVISGLTLLSNFTDSVKPKKSHVTLNVMADHHNNIKDALISIQNFCGVKGTEDLVPFGETLEGRTNFLRKIVLTPKAWFTSDVRVGNVPLTVEFKNLSFRLGTDGDSGEIKATFDFGDQTSSVISTISVTSEVPTSDTNVYVRDTDLGTVTKVYQEPGIYTVRLTVENDFGADTVIFEDYINAKIKAPNEAVIRLVENTTNQESTPGVPPDGPFEVFPKIRSPINTLIQIEVQSGESTVNDGYSFAGEPLDDDGNPIDPIETYSWYLGDDLTHANNPQTKASYSVGGIYDLKLRVDTRFGAFRITTYENCIDIIENQNLWLWIYQDENEIRSYEFGLISETFKLSSGSSLTVSRDSSFLDNVENSAQQKKAFNKNTGFAPRGTANSGKNGSTMLYYATGRSESDPVTSEYINAIEYQGFTDVYITRTPIQRQWNWANLNSFSNSYFIFGDMPTRLPDTSNTNQVKTSLSLSNLEVTNITLGTDNYIGGASELSQNASVFDTSGESIYGHFSVYKTAWKDNVGYLARNDGVGPFFRIKSFYRTEGTAGNPFLNIRKLQDIQGSTKTEGELTNLSAGIYFVNNSGSVSRFSESSSLWNTGGPGVNSLLYRSLQDTTVEDFDDPANTLLVASDGDKRAYLSFDYSSSAYISFNEIDLTFRSLISRPSGDQFIMGVY